jgi:DNA-binding MarR family transcriptional regulator
VTLADARRALDDDVHSPVRLCVMAVLHSVDSADYQTVKDALDVSYPLLSKHVALLEDAGYISVRKSFTGRTPRTVLALTRRGREAFLSHLAALDEIVRGLT